MFFYFSLSITYVYLSRFGEQIALRSILNHQVTHDDVGSHFYQTACAEVEQFLVF